MRAWLVLTFGLATSQAMGAVPDWAEIGTIFAGRCTKCHSDNSRLGAPPEGLRLNSLAQVLKGGDRLAVLPGNPEMSGLWRRITGNASLRMPFDGPPWLPEEDIRLIREWIAQGAMDSDGVTAPVPGGAEVRLRGTMTAPDAIDGVRFMVDDSTRRDRLPQVGAAAEMRGIVMPDGQVMATRLRRRCLLMMPVAKRCACRGLFQRKDRVRVRG